MSFTGSMTALVTPFRNGRIDEQAFRAFIDWQIASGTDALVPCGTTGEAATLSREERARLFAITIEQAAGRVSVLPGTGSNDTQTAIQFARLAKEAGADGHLSVTPYYNKPMPEGLYQHYKAIASAVDLPLILYNVPGRTGINMLPATVLRLAAIDVIVGIKEAAGKIEQVRQIVADAPPDFVLLSGEDAMNVEIYRAGGKGCISVTANVVPDRVAKIWDSFHAGNTANAEKLQTELQPLNQVMFIESNPIPAKTALAMMKKIAEEFRLPLTPIGEENRAMLRAVLQQHHLI